MTVSRVRNGNDTFVSSAVPSGHYPSWITLRIQGGSTVKNGLIYFKNPVPRGGTVLSATLHMYGSGNWGGSVSVDLQRLSSKWTQSEVDYANQPGVTGPVVTVTQTETVSGTEWAFNVAALLQTIADGAPNYGFRLSTSDTTEHALYSLNASAYPPWLEVDWTDAPAAPTELSPSGGSTVTVAKPTLLFNFLDVAGFTAMSALRVELKTTNSGWTDDPLTGGFASPDFDSGNVSSSDPELDLSTTAYGGLSVAASTYWTVQVQNAAGQWSKWSHPALFSRVARGTLTVGSPTGGVVSDATQTVLWSLSGATQTAWQVIVVDDSAPAAHLLNTGRRNGTATAYTIPAGIITSETTVYRLTVRVWDLPTRVKTPGDPMHTEVVETFSFVEDPTPNPPTSVTAAQVAAGQPHVKLDIVIAAAPDSFAIIRDGKFIDVDVVPADIYVSGTTYRYVDRSATPNQPHTWKVRSKDSGVLGPARSSASFTPAVGDVWVMDWSTPGSTRLVPIVVSLADLAFTMPELSTSYTPIDGNAPIVITQAQSGLAVDVAGRIVNRPGLTAAASVADMLWFKKYPQNQVRLTLGEQNLRGVISKVVLEPLSTGNTADRRVTFHFDSLDGPTQ